MKRNNMTLNEIKQKLIEIKGKQINLQNNRGRSKIEKFSGIIDNIYPAVFTFKTDNAYKTFSYSDILCGNVKIDNL